jgi:hypothetical protein
MAKEKAPYKIAKDGTVTIFPIEGQDISKAEFGAMNYAMCKVGEAEGKQVLAACTTKKALRAIFFPTRAQELARNARVKARMDYVNNSPEVTALHRQMVNAPDFMPALNK